MLSGIMSKMRFGHITDPVELFHLLSFPSLRGVLFARAVVHLMESTVKMVSGRETG